MDRDDELSRAERLLGELHKLGGASPDGMCADEKLLRYRHMLQQKGDGEPGEGAAAGPGQ